MILGPIICELNTIFLLLVNSWFHVYVVGTWGLSNALVRGIFLESRDQVLCNRSHMHAYKSNE